jgi:hypothetical protein
MAMVIRVIAFSKNGFVLRFAKHGVVKRCAALKCSFLKTDILMESGYCCRQAFFDLHSDEMRDEITFNKQSANAILL